MKMESFVLKKFPICRKPVGTLFNNPTGSVHLNNQLWYGKETPKSQPGPCYFRDESEKMNIKGYKNIFRPATVL